MLNERQIIDLRYKIEREKRLRTEGVRQYKRLDEDLKYLAHDPFMPLTVREPKLDHVTFAFVGGGFSGLVTCARLREVGVQTIRIIERGGDFGGTWYWNRYPGVRCDTASMVYMPLLEETEYVPTEKYASGTEILEHCRRIGKYADLYRESLFHTNVVDVRWLQEEGVWRIVTDRGDDFTAKFIGFGIGELNIPKLPRIGGIEEFEGRIFHASRWDYSYTGGMEDNAENLPGLNGKRVGIIGTGATAVQCVPKIAASASELFIFQRTPSAVFARDNHPINPVWFSEVAVPGWQDRWLRNFAENRSDLCPDTDLVGDGWTQMSRRACSAAKAAGPVTAEKLREAQTSLDYEYMESARQRVSSTVIAPSVAAKLKPWYGLFCKRPCFSDDYLPTFNLQNTHLVDTDGRGIDRVDATGVVANRQHIALDCLILATGFEAWTPYCDRLGFDPIGRNGCELSKVWRGGARTLHGIHVSGFPNLFVVDPNQGGSLYSNITHNILASASAIAAVVNLVESKRLSTVDVTEEAVGQWTLMLVNHGRRLGNDKCTPGRYNYEGVDPGAEAALNAGYPEGSHAFFQYLEDWSSQNGMNGLIFS